MTNADIRLGPDCVIDPGVRLGYLPGRPGAFGPARIGRPVILPPKAQR